MQAVSEYKRHPADVLGDGRVRVKADSLGVPMCKTEIIKKIALILPSISQQTQSALEVE